MSDSGEEETPYAGCLLAGRLAMWIVWLFSYLLLVGPAFAQSGFDEKYERDHNLFNPINQFDPSRTAMRNTP